VGGGSGGVKNTVGEERVKLRDVSGPLPLSPLPSPSRLAHLKNANTIIHFLYKTTTSL